MRVSASGDGTHTLYWYQSPSTFQRIQPIRCVKMLCGSFSKHDDMVTVGNVLEKDGEHPLTQRFVLVGSMDV